VSIRAGAIARGSAVGAVAGTLALVGVLVIAHLLLGMIMTRSGVVALAIPTVLLPLLCGGVMSVRFDWHKRSQLATAFDGAVLYLGAMAILFLFIVVRFLAHPGNLGEAFLALPILFGLCVVAGVPATIASALVIRMLSLSAEAHRNVA